MLASRSVVSRLLRGWETFLYTLKGKEEPHGPAKTGRVRLPTYPSGSVAPSGNRRNPKSTPNWSSLPASPAVAGRGAAAGLAAA